MQSGTFSSNTGTTFNLSVDWTATQNSKVNTTTVKEDIYLEFYKLQVGARSGSYAKIGDFTESFSVTAINEGNTSTSRRKLIHTFSKEVPHNSDGSKSIVLSAYYPAGITYSGKYIADVLAKSSTITLDPIDVNFNAGTCSVNVTAATSTTTVIVKVSGAYSIGDLSYNYQYKKNNGNWTALSVTGSTSLSVNLSTLGVTSGDIIYFRSVTSSTQGTSGTSTISSALTIALYPTSPTMVSVTPSPCNYKGNLTVSWSGATAQSGTIDGYKLYYRYKANAQQNWSQIALLYTLNSDTSSQLIQLDIFPIILHRNGILEFHVSTINSFGLESAKRAVAVQLKGAVLYKKISGVQVQYFVYEKKNGIVKAIDGIYLHQNGINIEC